MFRQLAVGCGAIAKYERAFVFLNGLLQCVGVEADGSWVIFLAVRAVGICEELLE